MTINYQDLLQRYIRHVGEAEGSTFMHCLNDHTRSDVKFTHEEVCELERLDELARAS